MVRALVGDSTMTRVDMEISKKRIAAKLNSQVEIISAKCQDEISRLGSDLILTQTAQKGEKFFQLQARSVPEDWKR